MSDVEDRLRDLLHEMADEARPAPLLERLSVAQVSPLRRVLVVGAAACVLAAAAVGGLALVRSDPPGSIEPAKQPPEVLRFSSVQTPRPGVVDLAVLFADAGTEAVEATPVYLWTGQGPATRLPASESVPAAITQHLSADGTHLVRQNNRLGDNRIEVVDLVTGRINSLDDVHGFCPALSPDNRTVAVFDYSERDVVELVDVLRGTTTRLGVIGGTRDCGYNSFAWAPDGERLLVRSTEDSVLLDLDGSVLGRVEGAAPANGSMSWSPDGTEVLVYRAATGDYALASTRTGRTVRLSAPAPFARPMGWTGSRIVWLTGAGSDQALVSTETDGSDRRTWVRLIVDQPVLTVEWSRDLAGSAPR